MKIIHLTSGNVWGGSECYILELYKRQTAEGHDVEIISADRPDVVNIFRQLDCKVTTMQMHGHVNILTPVRLAMKILAAKGPVVIHVHKFNDALIAANARRLAGNPDRVRIVSTTHIIEPAATDRKHTRMYDSLDAMIFVSKAALDCFLSTNPAVDRSRLHIVHNSISRNRIHYEIAKRRDNDRVELMYAGRLIQGKGVDTLIEAMSMIPDAGLKICGKGEDAYVAELKSMAERLNVADRIKWVDFQSDIFSQIATADIGVVPSLQPESFGLIILEFMSHAVPVVTTDNGAQKEIITDGVDGMPVPPGNPAKMAEAIRRLVEDRHLRDRIGKSGLTTFQNRFSYDDFYKKIISVYKGA